MKVDIDLILGIQYAIHMGFVGKPPFKNATNYFFMSGSRLAGGWSWPSSKLEIRPYKDRIEYLPLTTYLSNICV